MSTNLTTDQIAEKIRSSALLVSLQLGSYNPEKTDLVEGKKVSDSHGIKKKDVFKVKKNTMPATLAFKNLKKHDTVTRALVEAVTAPFARGIGLLPAVKFFELRQAVNIRLDERAVLVKRLIDSYSIEIESAKRSLNGAFKEGDYPSVEYVASRFYAKLDSFAIADPKQSRMGVLSDIAEQIQAAQNETLNDKLSTVVPYLRELLLSALCHQSSVLQNPDSKLYETTFTNVLEAAEQADHLNMLGDEQINNAIFAIRDQLNRTKDQVKGDDHLRKTVLADCNNIIESLDGTIPPPIASKGTGKAKKAKKAKAPILCDVLPPPPAEIIVPELAEEPEEEQPKTPISSATSLTDEVTETPSPSGFDADAMLAKLGW